MPWRRITWSVAKWSTFVLLTASTAADSFCHYQMSVCRALCPQRERCCLLSMRVMDTACPDIPTTLRDQCCHPFMRVHVTPSFALLRSVSPLQRHTDTGYPWCCTFFVSSSSPASTYSDTTPHRTSACARRPACVQGSLSRLGASAHGHAALCLSLCIGRRPSCSGERTWHAAPPSRP